MTQREHGATQAPVARAQQALEHACGEPAHVVSFGDLRYKVPGRTRDGYRTDASGPISLIFFMIIGIAGAVAALSAGLFDPFELFHSKKSKVTGPAEGAALTLADAARDTKDTAFLVWSANHLALVACDWATTRIVWQASHAQRPSFDPATGVTSWPDGSQIAFAVPSWERKRLQQSNG